MRSPLRRLVLVVCASSGPAALGAQGMGKPTNDLPNPYQTIAGWATLPEGRTWGSLSAVDIDRDGHSVWVAERCGANSCTNSALPSVMKFNASGKLVTSFASGLFISPHGMAVDRDGNIWVADCACTGAPRSGADTTGPKKGHQVFKFSPDGKLLMTLGVAGGAREPGQFWQPNDVLVAPNGDIFVAEGHASAPGSNARILKFSSDGKLLKSWGKFGKGPGEFDQPHALAMDSRAACSSATAATTASRSSTRTERCSTHGTSSAGRAGST
ncbi:MAG: hypothetical protein U0163_05170 [Gemmatimonadaceae bacterium]